jgi:hypothetical protein
MADPYAKATMSYLHRIGAADRGWLVIGSIPALILVRLCFVAAAEGRMLFPLMLELALSALVAIHIRDQFLYPPSRLIPDYHKVHGVIACAFAGVVAILLPAIFTALAGWNSVGFISITLLLFGIVLWLALLRSAQFSWLIFAALILGERQGGRYLDLFASGQLELEAAMLFIAGIAVVASAAFCLLRRNEESWLCRGEIETIGAVRVQMDGSDAEDRMRLSWPRWSGIHTTSLIRHAKRAAQSRLSRICRWQAGMPRGWSAFIPALIAVGYVLLQCVIERHDVERSDAWFHFALMGSILPALVLSNRYPARATTISYEFFLPVTRKEYLKQIGAAAAFSQFQSWAVVAAVLTIWWLVVSPAVITVAGLISVLTISFLWQFTLFGAAASFCLPLFQKNSATLIVFWFALLFLMLNWWLARPRTEWQYGIIGLSVFFALIGLLGTWAAYRYWLVTDID